MVAPPLVDSRLDDGRRLIEDLDQNGFDVKAALWYYFVEPGEWRLLIASSMVPSEGPRKAYKRLQGLLPKDSAIELRNISLVSPNDEQISLLRQVIRTGPGITNLHFVGTTINGVFIPDAFIYRLN